MSKTKNNYARITTRTLSEMKLKGEKIAMLTAYDFTMARILDKAGIDVILVGDSASNVMAGQGAEGATPPPNPEANEEAKGGDDVQDVDFEEVKD